MCAGQWGGVSSNFIVKSCDKHQVWLLREPTDLGTAKNQIFDFPSPISFGVPLTNTSQLDAKIA